MEYTQELRRELTKFERIVLELAERVEGAAGQPAGFRAAVTALRGALDQVGRAAFLTLVARSEETADTVVDAAGTVHRFKQAAAKDWLTLWGPVVVVRRLFQADRGGRCRVPVDEHCGMVDRYLTSELERATAFLGAQLTPAEVEAALAEVLVQSPSRTAIQHVLARVGGCAETQAVAVEAAVAATAPLALEADVLVVSWDGTTVPLREPAPVRGRPPERPGLPEAKVAATAWKEAGVGMVASYWAAGDPASETAERVDVRYFARMPEPKMATLIDQVAQQTAAALAAGTFAHQVFLADGKREIWRVVGACPVFEGFTTIVDFYHAAEHLSHAAEALFGKSTADAQHWYRRWRHKLQHQHGGVAALQRSLHYHQQRLQKGSDRWRQVTSERGYFRNNQARMDYAGYRAAGLPIGSGPVEAACKTIVGQRLKRSGMRWTRAGGQHILNLRVPLQSKRWDAFWNWYLAHTDQLAKAA